MKQQTISGLITLVNEFISSNPDLSLSSVCLLALWNPSSYSRATKSRKLKPIQGGKSNPMAKLQDLIEAHDCDGAYHFLEAIMDFRVACAALINAQAEPKASKVESGEAPEVESGEAPEVESGEAPEVESGEADDDELKGDYYDDDEDYYDDDLDNLD